MMPTIVIVPKPEVEVGATLWLAVEGAAEVGTTGDELDVAGSERAAVGGAYHTF